MAVRAAPLRRAGVGAPGPDRPGWALLAAVGVAAAVAAGAGAWAPATYGARTTADEPQYLLSAISLAEDGDLDIADELAAERWRDFHAAGLPEQTRPLPGGRRVSPHDPLLPLLLVPGVALGGWLGAKLTLAGLAGALAALLTWTATTRFAVPASTAALTTAAFTLSAPLAPYGTQVYPELPAALAIALAIAALTTPPATATAGPPGGTGAAHTATAGQPGGTGAADAATTAGPPGGTGAAHTATAGQPGGTGAADAATTAGPPGGTGIADAAGGRSAWVPRGRGRAGWVAGLGGAVVALPWLAVKYAPVGAVLAGIGVVRLWREGRRGLALGLVGGLGAAGVAYLAVHQVVWTGWTPYASADHFAGSGELGVVGFAPDWWGRSRRLIGLLVDRSFGIAAWQPAWLLAVPAVAGLAASRPRGWAALAAPLGAGWLVATFVALTMHGWWFPGRQVVAVLPAAVIAVAVWASTPRRRAGVAVLGAAGVLAHAWLTAEALTGRLTLVVDFAATANPLVRAWRTVLPDYLDVTTTTWALHGAWIAVAAALAVAVVRSRHQS